MIKIAVQKFTVPNVSKFKIAIFKDTVNKHNALKFRSVKEALGENDLLVMAFAYF
jgi:hypothetical protein